MINLLTAAATAVGKYATEQVVNLESRASENDDSMGEWCSKLIYQQYFQNVMLSDGTDPDNQPEW